MVTLPSSPGGVDQPAEVASLVARLRAVGGTAALCGSCHQCIPSVSGVGLTVFATSGRRFVLGTSGLLIDSVEDLQIRLDQGPCVDAINGREPVLVANLADAGRRWPRFAVEARHAGVAAVFAFPILADDEPVAVLDLCRSTPGPLSDDACAQAKTFTMAASTLLVDDLNGGSSAGAAVSTPVARIQQATGIVMGQARTSAGDALHQLRHHAFARDLPLSAVVDDVLDGTLRFDRGSCP